jgi:hypothetical protein
VEPIQSRLAAAYCDAHPVYPEGLDHRVGNGDRAITLRDRPEFNSQLWGPKMNLHHPPTTASPDFADDLLEGAEEIARFIWGPDGSRRKVYYLAASSRIPVFRLGTKLCARRSVLLEWITSQENRALFRASTAAISTPS